MPFNSETARAAQAKSSKIEGVRKDAISHGLRSSIMTVHGGYPNYFVWLLKNLPTKHADMLSKYIPTEIEQTINLDRVQVLNITMPEPREAINVSEVKQLDVIVDVECDDTPDVVTPDETPEDAL